MTRTNPPWSDAAIADAWHRLEAGVPDRRWLPTKATTGHWNEHGEGGFGVAMPTHDPAITMKLTRDMSEAHGVAHMLGLYGVEKWPEGIAKHYAVFSLGDLRTDEWPDMTNRSVYVLWRDSVTVPHGLYSWDAHYLLLAASAASSLRDQTDPDRVRSLIDEYATNIDKLSSSAIKIRRGLLTMLRDGILSTDCRAHNVGRAPSGHNVLYDLGQLIDKRGNRFATQVPTLAPVSSPKRRRKSAR